MSDDIATSELQSHVTPYHKIPKQWIALLLVSTTKLPVATHYLFLYAQYHRNAIHLFCEYAKLPGTIRRNRTLAKRAVQPRMRFVASTGTQTTLDISTTASQTSISTTTAETQTYKQAVTSKSTYRKQLPRTYCAQTQTEFLFPTPLSTTAPDLVTCGSAAQEPRRLHQTPYGIAYTNTLPASTQFPEPQTGEPTLETPIPTHRLPVTEPLSCIVDYIDGIPVIGTPPLIAELLTPSTSSPRNVPLVSPRPRIEHSPRTPKRRRKCNARQPGRSQPAPIPSPTQGIVIRRHVDLTDELMNTVVQHMNSRN